MNYTQNYQLNQWEETDRVLMEDFNSDNQKIDAALGTKCEIICGTYTGDGSSTRSITLGFQPKALYICNQAGMAGYIEGYYYIWGGLAMPGIPIVDLGHNNAVAVEITSTGFKLLSNDHYRKINENNHVYLYWALR